MFWPLRGFSSEPSPHRCQSQANKAAQGAGADSVNACSFPEQVCVFRCGNCVVVGIGMRIICVVNLCQREKR